MTPARRLGGSARGPRRPWRAGSTSAGHPRRRPLSRRLAQLGLRARVTVAFALGALVLSGALSGLTYAVTRNFLLQQRERAAVQQAFVNAQVARDVLRAPGPDVPRLLAALEAAGGARGVLLYRHRWFATSLTVGRDTLPLALRGIVAAGVPARQGFRRGTEPWFAVGVPLPAAEAAYFEVVPIGQLERTLATLGFSLLGAGVVTTAAGVAMGRWLSTRLLRPLADVSETAAAIAGGELGTRLEAPDDRDLAPLASSFNAMVDALAERIAREARFVSDVSHELRSPLTTLATSLGVMVARRSEMPERAQSALELLAGEVTRFERLVEDLLEISRFDAGVAELHLEEVRLAELILQAIAVAPEPRCELEIGPGVDRLVVRADKRRVERIVANLVENASSHGGGVTRIALERRRSSARLLVEDAGPGVPPEERVQVFERFFRGGAAGRRGRGEGSGLGLALVEEHARLHGGQVWVEDATGGTGARFVVELPLVRG